MNGKRFLRISGEQLKGFYSPPLIEGLGPLTKVSTYTETRNWRSRGKRRVRNLPLRDGKTKTKKIQNQASRKEKNVSTAGPGAYLHGIS